MNGTEQGAGPHAGMNDLVERLWDASSAGDEYAAADAALAALDGGVDPEVFLLDVVAPVQARVGVEWAANRITVAQEHTATAINERVIGALAHHDAVRARRPADGAAARRATVACIDGEWHAMPARILSEVLRLRGWHVDYLGAQVPTPHLIAHLHQTGPEVVALSSSIITRLPTAHATITACQATGTPVLVGGAAYGGDGAYATLLGADAWASNGRAAAERLSGGQLSAPVPVHETIDDLPHLTDQEYTYVARTAPELVRFTLDGLEERFPDMAGYTDQQRRHTAEDIAFIVEFLGTALYLDEAEAFSGFLLWTAGILVARGVPAHSLLPALDLLDERLADFPRSRAILTHAHEVLRKSEVPGDGPAA
ncbi:cobalamin-dependent protein [Spirillospora sp. NPDC047279]|uniref:cobalamin B12-binding domain-containing protein n=1 Tax=Spirillospora sp. NPDC047279 TaxID=3155478 RepID=UPI003408932F